MRTRIIWLCFGILLGSLLSTPVVAQVAQRLFATKTADLTTGVSTPLLCTASGAGCYLNVVVH